MLVNPQNLNDLTFCIAEVIDIQPVNTYSYDDGSDPDRPNNSMNLFTVWVRMDGYVHKPKVPVKPINVNIKKIPLIGELVLIFKSNSSVVHSTMTEGQYNQEQWYYISTIDVNSSINNNTVTGYTNNSEYDTEADPELKGKSFKEVLTSPLQVYEGDIIIEGRGGNSIRFGNTLNDPLYDGYHIKQTEMFSGEVGDPITIISNGRVSKEGNEFVTEHANLDNASIWLTSTQRLNKFELNYKTTIADNPNLYNKSQLIGSADRIILTSKLDDIILDAKKGIEIHAPLIKFGVSEKKEGLIHSTALVKILDMIISVIEMGVIDTSTGIMCTPINTGLSSSDIKDLRKQLVNRNVLFDIYSDN